MNGVVLLNSCFIRRRRDYLQDTGPHLRVGVASLAAFLRRGGVPVAVLDPQAEKLTLERLVARVAELSPRWLGLTAYTEEVADAHLIARAAKKTLPGLGVIAGGPHVSALPRESIAEFDRFDLVCLGEGERTLLDVVRGRPRAEIPGLAGRSDGGQVFVNAPGPRLDMDELPFPAWDLYRLERYPRRLPVEPLRGCPGRCSFCFRALGREVRYRSPGRIVAEMRENIAAYGVRDFIFEAGTFPLGRRHALETCRAIAAGCPGVRWTASTRAEMLDRELVALMKASGCSRVEIGVESGDERILRACGKKQSPALVARRVAMAARAGIALELNYILGFPEETISSTAATFRLAHRLRRHAANANFAILTPFPGTDIYRQAVSGRGNIALRSRDWADFCKQGGMAARHRGFPGRRQVLIQYVFYLSYYLLSPRQARGKASPARAAALLEKLF